MVVTSCQFANAQQIDTTTTYDWDTTLHQFSNSGQQIFNYNAACYLTRYTINFWDTTSQSYIKYYRSTNNLLANNATSQTLVQLWDEANTKWMNFQKQIFTYTTSPTLPASVLYQNWQANSSWLNSHTYYYTYDANGNLTSVVLKFWNAGNWVNSEQDIYTYNSSNLMTSFLKQNWYVSATNWSNSNLNNYTYTSFNKLLQDSGKKWNASTTSWVNNYQNLYAYDANNYLVKWNYNTWDTTTHTYLQSQQYQYTNNAIGNALETLALNFNGSSWDTLYKDVNHYNGCVLPVSLVAFTATNAKEKIQLDWQTSNEINVSHFNIQRSVNGKDFDNIGQIKAANKTDNIYSYYDPLGFSKNSSSYYYRLEIIDKDGSKTYSEIKQVNILQKELFVKIFPNPAVNYINVTGKNIKQILISDITGKLLLQKDINISGFSNTQLPTNGFGKGNFIIKVVDGDLQCNYSKIVIQ